MASSCSQEADCWDRTRACVKQEEGLAAMLLIALNPYCIIQVALALTLPLKSRLPFCLTMFFSPWSGIPGARKGIVSRHGSWLFGEDVSAQANAQDPQELPFFQQTLLSITTKHLIDQLPA